MYDIHVHSTFSHDGKSRLEEYALLLDKNSVDTGFFGISRNLDGRKLKGIGFAEHVDFLPECGGYGLFDYTSYKASINEFKQKGYEFYAGAEIDYSYRVEKEIAASLKEEYYDYVISSVHMINGLSVSTDENVESFRNINMFRDILEKYYHEVGCSLKVKEFDAIGHIDIYRRYFKDDFFESSPLRSCIEEMDNELSRACAKSDKIIEVNSSGLFSPSGSTFPGTEFIKSYFDYGGRMVCLGSDAHNASHVARGFDAVIELLKGIGFRYVFLPWKKDEVIGLG